MRNIFLRWTAILSVLTGLGINAVQGQIFPFNKSKSAFELDYDSLYIKPFYDKITTRMYYSKKYTNMDLYDPVSEIRMNYESNTSLNLGFGATVNSVSLNLSYGFKFLNPESNGQKTKYLDLQTNIYTRKFIIDLFGQFYQGLYLENTRALQPDYAEEYYQRPDFLERIIGFNAQYIFNNKKFSYRAPFVHNERQLKSAGTFLAGIEGYYGYLEGDSSLVPSFILNRGDNQIEGVNNISFFQIGPSGGYAYSLVLWSRFFATLSLTMNLTYGFNSAEFQERGLVKSSDVSFGALARFAIGYNDDNWFLGFSLVNNAISNAHNSEDISANIGVGVYKFTFAWRFNVSPKAKKFVDFIP